MTSDDLCHICRENELDEESEYVFVGGQYVQACWECVYMVEGQASNG